jgi:hypothetical protein
MEYYKGITIEQIYNYGHTEECIDKLINVSVSDILKHLNVLQITNLLKFAKITKIQEPENTIKIQKTTQGLYSQEYIADITGIAIPMYFQYITTGKCTVSDIVSQKIYDLYKVSTIPQRSTNKITFNSFINDDDYVVIEPEALSPENKIIENILKDATKWNSISNGITVKLDQITNYDWIDKDTIDKCVRRLSKLITNGAEYEVFVKRDQPEKIETPFGSLFVNIYGYIDCIDRVDNTDAIWELKCCENIEPSYYLQVILYYYLMKDLKGSESSKDARGYLFNVLTNELYEISIEEGPLKEFIELLLKYKYSYEDH